MICTICITGIKFSHTYYLHPISYMHHMNEINMNVIWIKCIKQAASIKCNLILCMKCLKQLILWTVKQLDQLILTRPLCKLNRPMTHSRLVFAGSTVPLESDRNELKTLMSSQFLSLPISMTNQFSYIINHVLLVLLFTSVCINKIKRVSQKLLKKNIFLLLL